MKLLTVDHSVAVRTRLSQLFEDLSGIDVIQAAELDEGYAKLRQFTPDAMVLEPIFPGANGLELLAYAKRHFPSVTVLINTNAIVYRDQCLALGADRFFDKSLEISDLVDAIVRLRDRSLAAGQAATARAGERNHS